MTHIFTARKPWLAPTLKAEIASAAARLQEKLERLDVGTLRISDYNKNYLRRKLKNPIGTLQLYSHLLALSLSDMQMPLAEVTFVDYGGGTGLLSLLARQLGIGCVLYNDIYPVSCQDVQVVADAVGLAINHCVCGDIEELIAYVDRKRLCVDAIASYDVLEHIYDVEGYFKRLRTLPSNGLRVVFGSSANAANPFIRRRFQHIQRRREYCDRTRKPGHNERDGHRAFLEVRKEIVRSCESAMDEGLVVQLAKATRGLRQADIEAVVKKFLQTGAVLYTPTHPTNTCDPLTGNWAEHLMPAHWLTSLLTGLGFQVQILAGPWRYDQSMWKRLVKTFLNGTMTALKHRALCIAPYFIVHADHFVERAPRGGSSIEPSAVVGSAMR